MEEIKHYGFIEPVIENDHWVLGGLTNFKGVPLTDGHWLNYRPDREMQYNSSFDTNGCSEYGTLNALETLFFFLYGKKMNWSERFLAVLAENTRAGNDPHKVIEAARNNGLIDDTLLPFNSSITTWDHWKSPVPMREDLLSKGVEFLESYEINHDWVPTTIDNFKEALKYSPLAVAVVAWIKEGDLYFSPPNNVANHWVELLDYVDGQYWIVYDSYDNEIKNMKWNSCFYYAKRYYIGKAQSQKVSLYQMIANFFLTIFKIKNNMTTPDPIIPPDQTPPPPVQPPVVTPPVPVPSPVLLWDTPTNVRHSCRVVMDEFKLSWKEKDLLCAVIKGESGFNTKAVNNVTHDYGVCQINNFYWIGPGKEFASVEEVINNPAKSVRFMVRQYKAGHLDYWIAYKNGSYKQYL